MRVSVYNTLSSPYYFETSNAIGSSLPKSAGIGGDISYGRGVVLESEDLGFSYSIKKLSAGNQTVRFVEIPEKPDTTLKIRTIQPLMIDSLNRYLLSEPFNVTEDMDITFIEEGGFITMDNADTSLVKEIGKGKYVNCKLELIDEDAKKTIGTVKETKFPAENTTPSKFKGYMFKITKKGVKHVRLKMELSTNVKGLQGMFVDEYGTVTENTLSKIAMEQVSLEVSEIPVSYALEQNYPNPFNPVTTIQYSLPEDTQVSIVIYNVNGQKVRELVNGFKPAGSYTVIFDGKSLASGMYFYKIEAGEFSKVKRMLLVK